jgi:hypothetical protein
VQFTGPENIGPERAILGLSPPGPVLSPTRITLENNEKILPQPDRENAFVRASGGPRHPRNKISLGADHGRQALLKKVARSSWHSAKACR